PGAVEQRLEIRIFRRREPLPHPVGKLLRSGVYCHDAELFALIEAQTAVNGTTEDTRLFKYRLVDRSEFAGRGIDDLQHLRRRGLLLQSLARLGQEPRILHRNDRLRREILQQRYLLVRERPGFTPGDREGAYRSALLDQSNPDHGTDFS